MTASHLLQPEAAAAGTGQTTKLGLANLGGALLGLGLQFGLAAPAQAALWSIDHSLASRLDANDNPALAASAGEAVFSLQLSGQLAASRQTESARTRLDLAASLSQAQNDSPKQRLGASLALGQTWSQPREQHSLSLQWQQDQTDDPSRGSVDLGLGRGWRRTLGLSAGWTHALSETTSTQWTASDARVEHSSELRNAVDYRNTAFAGSLARRLHERITISLQGSSEAFRTLPEASNRSRTDSLLLGLRREGADASVGSFSLGRYRLQRDSGVLLQVCPAPVSFCQAGLVQPVLLRGFGRSQQQGWQFNASQTWRADERTDLQVVASRRQLPAGSGTVVRSDALNLQLSRAISEKIKLQASADLNRSTFPAPQPGANATQTQLGMLALTLSARLGQALSLQVGAQTRRFSSSQSSQKGVSHSLWLSLSFEPPRHFAQS